MNEGPNKPELKTDEIPVVGSDLEPESSTPEDIYEVFGKWVGVSSDIGGRESLDDRYGAGNVGNISYYVVCDGYQLEGGQAAQTVVEDIPEILREFPPEKINDQFFVINYLQNLVNELQKSLASKEVTKTFKINQFGMPEEVLSGTTLTLVLKLTEEDIYLVQIGDSILALEYEDGSIEKVSESHNHQEHQNVLMKSLQLGRPQQNIGPQIKKIEGVEGIRRMFLCSDGVITTNYGKEADQLEKLIQQVRGIENPQEASDNIVKEALKNGSTDNVTVMVVKLGESEVE